MLVTQTRNDIDSIISQDDAAMVHYPRKKIALSLFNERAFNAPIFPIAEINLIGKELKQALVVIDPEKVMGHVDGLLSQYKKTNITDPKIFMASIGKLFSEYPESAVAQVCRDLPRQSPFAPSIAEASKALESITSEWKRDIIRLRKMHQMHEDRKAEAENREARKLKSKTNGEEDLLTRLKRQYAEKQEQENQS